MVYTAVYFCQKVTAQLRNHFVLFERLKIDAVGTYVRHLILRHLCMHERLEMDANIGNLKNTIN